MQQKDLKGGQVGQDLMGLLQHGKIQYQRGNGTFGGNTQNGEGDEAMKDLGWELVAKGGLFQLVTYYGMHPYLG